MFWATEVLFCSVCLWPPVIYCVMWLTLLKSLTVSVSVTKKIRGFFFFAYRKASSVFWCCILSARTDCLIKLFFFLVNSSFTVLKPNTGKSVSYWIKCAENMWKFYSCSKSVSQGLEGEANIHLIHLIFWRCV